MLEEQFPSHEIRPEIQQTLEFAEKIIRGNYGNELPDEESLDPAEVFSGPVLDLNDETLTEKEKAIVLSWIEKQLGSKPEDAPVKGKHQSPDGQTTVEIFDVPLGQEDDPWFISRWQNEGEQPSYIFWSQEMYEQQVELAG